LADLRVRNSRVEEALHISEEEGLSGLTKRWIDATDQLRVTKLENNRRLEEIEALRRQRHIYKLNYESEVTAHIATAYRALSMSATIDERDVIQELAQEKPLFSNELEVMQEESENLQKWLAGYVEEEEIFISERKAQSEKLNEAAKSMHQKAAFYLKEEPGTLRRVKQDYMAKRGVRVPFDTSGMLYRKTTITTPNQRASRPNFHHPNNAWASPSSAASSSRPHNPPVSKLGGGGGSPIRLYGVEEGDDNPSFRQIRFHENGFPGGGLFKTVDPTASQVERRDRGRGGGKNNDNSILHEEIPLEKRIPEPGEPLSPVVDRLGPAVMRKHFPDMVMQHEKEDHKVKNLEHALQRESRRIDQQVASNVILPRNYVSRQWKP